MYALVGGDAEVGDATAAGELVDADVGAEAADYFCAVQSEHDRVSYSIWFMTMVAERAGSLSIPFPFTSLKLLSNSPLPSAPSLPGRR